MARSRSSSSRRSTTSRARCSRTTSAAARSRIAAEAAALQAIGGKESEREAIDVDAADYLGSYTSPLFDVELKREEAARARDDRQGRVPEEGLAADAVAAAVTSRSTRRIGSSLRRGRPARPSSCARPTGRSRGSASAGASCRAPNGAGGLSRPHRGAPERVRAARHRVDDDDAPRARARKRDARAVDADLRRRPCGDVDDVAARVADGQVDQPDRRRPAGVRLLVPRDPDGRGPGLSCLRRRTASPRVRCCAPWRARPVRSRTLRARRER